MEFFIIYLSAILFVFSWVTEAWHIEDDSWFLQAGGKFVVVLGALAIIVREFF